MRLTKQERETIILYNQAEDIAEIYTHDPSLIKKLESDPETAVFKSDNGFGGRTYIVPKKELIIKLKQHSTGVARQKLVKHAGTMRNTSKNKKILNQRESE